MKSTLFHEISNFTLFPYSYIRSLMYSQNEGRKEIAAPWRNGYSRFSFSCKSYKQSGCKGRSPTGTLIRYKILQSELQNIRESILDFMGHPIFRVIFVPPHLMQDWVYSDGIRWIPVKPGMTWECSIVEVN